MEPSAGPRQGRHDLGYRVYGLAAIALGALGLASGDFASVWQPVPAGLPGRAALAYGVAVVLLLAGAAIQWRRTAAYAAMALTALYALGALLLHVPRVAMSPSVLGAWLGLAEQVALLAGGTLAYASIAAIAPARAARLFHIGRLTFGACLIVFGLAHFVYLAITASTVPKWIPPGQTFWAVATGAAHLAAGAAILAGRMGRLASRLLTAMFIGFGLLVHLPAVIRDPTSHMNWAANAVNLALIGAAWTLADAIGARER